MPALLLSAPCQAQLRTAQGHLAVSESVLPLAPTHVCGRMKELIQGFGEMKGKALIKISFKMHQDFFFHLVQISSHPKSML